MAVAFPSASTVSLQAPDPGEPSGSMLAPGSGGSDPFAAMLASASVVPATAVDDLPDASGAAASLWTEAATTWPEPASDELPSEQLISLLAVPALPGLVDAPVDGAAGATDSQEAISPDLAAALGAAAPWPFQASAALPAGDPVSILPAGAATWSAEAPPQGPPPGLVLATHATWTSMVAPTSAAPSGTLPVAPQGAAGPVPPTLDGILPPAPANALPAAGLAATASLAGPASPTPPGPAQPLAAAPVPAAPPGPARTETASATPGAETPRPAPAQTAASAVSLPTWPTAAPVLAVPAAANAVPAAAASDSPSPNPAPAAVPAAPVPAPLPGWPATAPTAPTPTATNAALATPAPSMAAPDVQAPMPALVASAATVAGGAILPAATAPAPWLPPVSAGPRSSPTSPASGPASASPDDVPADPLRALLLSALRPGEARRTAGIPVTGVPTPTATADPAAADEALPASGILALTAGADGDTPAALPAWQRPELPIDQRPAASQAVGADAPPPASIPAAALQLQAARAPDPRRSTPVAGSEPSGLEALRTTATSPLDTRGPAAEAPVLRASPPTPVDRAIAGQITRQLVHTEANGDRTLVIRLTPAELGTVRIELREHNGTLTAHLRVEDEAVGRAIDRMLPSMRQELRGQDSPLADVVREPRDQRDQRGNGQPQDQSTPWSRQQERDSNRQGRRQTQEQAQAAFSLAGLVDEDAPLVPGAPAAGLARPLR